MILKFGGKWQGINAMYNATYREKATGKTYTIETDDYNNYFSEDIELITYEYIKPSVVLTGYDLFELFGEDYGRI